METPQEVEVWLILPAVRRQIVIELKKHGLKQKDIAKIMSITEPAVSQYLNNKRGEGIEFGKIINAQIIESAAAIAKGENFMQELQNIMKLVKKSRFICEVCHDHTGTEENCKICYR